jgi:cyclic pyranopterin phosphate synthase
MVDIGSKEIQQRSAKATGHIRMSEGTLKLIGDNLIKKGDVLTVAQIAGINAAKSTSSLIPLCHNIVLDNVSVRLTPDESGIVAESEVRCTGRTGAEMEALTAVTVALMTIYDMCKAVDSMMVLDRIMVTEKTKK